MATVCLQLSIQNPKLSLADPILHDLIKHRNKYRRKFQKTGNPSINYIETCSTSVNTLWERKLIWQTFKRKKNGLHTLANIQNYRRHKNPYFKIPTLQNAACNTFCCATQTKKKRKALLNTLKKFTTPHGTHSPHISITK